MIFARQFARLTLALALTATCARAANVVWTGNTSTDFEAAANWTALPANDLVSDSAEFATLSGNQPRLTVSRSLNALIFSTPSGGWTLSAADPAFALSLGGNGLNASNQTAGNVTLAADLVATTNQTWQVGTGGNVRATGSVRLGASGTPLASQLIIGNTTSGDLVFDPSAGESVAIYGNVTNGAAALQITQRLSFGSDAGSTDSVNVISNAGGPGIRLATTGVLTVRSGTWRTNDAGSNNTSAFTGTLNITGGTFATGGARYFGQFNGAVGTTVNLSGGNLLVTGGGNSVVNSGYLGLGGSGVNTPTGRISFNVSGGTLDVAKAAGNLPAGVPSGQLPALLLGGTANTTVLVNQTGGAVRVGVTTGSHVFTGATNGNTNANLSIGSNLTANAAAYTLAGGTLTVAGNVTGVAPTGGGVSNFNFLGGSLTVGHFDATNLGSSSTATGSANQTAESVALGTLVNRGGSLVPGGDGTAGRTLITGHYSVASASAQLLLDLNGTTAATAFQTGTHDFVSITGNATLGGTLAFKVAGFTPTSNQTFTVLTAAGGLSGAFSNAPSGTRLVSTDGLHTFAVTQNSTSVTLGSYIAVGPPTIASASVPSNIIEGGTIVLSVTTTSLSPGTYSWTKNGVAIPGATGAALTLVNLAPADEGTYVVTASNSAGSTTQSFLVRPTAAPANIREELDVGASRTFTASAGAASYSWVLDGEQVSTAASYTYTPARRAVGVHWLRVTETYPDASKLTRDYAIQVRLPAFTAALSYYVSPTGSDSNAGTIAAPFLTLEKARDTIRLLSSGAKSGGVTVYLRGGIHRRTSTFTLAAQDSGTESAPIQYLAYPGETPILTTSKPIASSQISPLAASEYARVAPGVSTARIWEIDVTGNARANAFPNVFNEWTIFNAFRSTQNGGLLELFYQGERRKLSRYPNENATDDRLTTNILMDGVAPGTSIVKDSTGTYVTTTNSYLNFAGTYFHSDGSQRSVGGAFYYPLAEASRIARWATALNAGGLWVQGYWRVPWQINAAKVSFIDSTNRVIGFVTATNANDPLISNGIGDKYTRTANTTLNLGVGSKKEPWWVVNLLEEMDVPGEWAVDFARKKLYYLMGTDGAPADGDLELSDVSTPLIQLNGASDVRLEGLTFRRHLGVNVQILNGTRNLIRGCTFTQSGNMAVDINGGTEHGVLSSDFEKLASGGIMLRGGSVTIPSGATTPSAVTPSNFFAVNNRFRSFSEVVRVYQAAIDVGFGGPIGSWSVTPHVAGMRVASNFISTSPHAGILWHGYQHVIEYNELTDFTRISQDLGGIYRFGPNQDNNTVIRYNHLYASPLGEGIYNDFDHVRTPIYGNTVNLKTPSTAGRGYGIWTNTNTATGGAVAGIPTTLQVYNNIAVNSRSNFSLHSSSGAPIQNNISYRKLSADFAWYRITVNTTTNTQSYGSSNATTLSLAPTTNKAYTTDPGFVDFANDDLRLRPDAQAYTDLPNFTPIPLELTGLYLDATRNTGNRVWKPFIVTHAVSALGANTATFNGSLAYPQFDANATVRVYWGPTDGADDPTAWQNNATLGTLRAGPVSYTPTNLTPGTRYYYRFMATNSAGDHWAERSNVTTTYAFVSSPPSGSITADSAALPAANAVDADAATLWRASATTGTLTYTFPTATRVTRYSLVSSTESAARDPRDWTLQASNDGTTWVTLDSETAQTFASRGETRSYGFVNANPYFIYRLVVSANNGDTTALSLAEWTLSVPQETPDTVGPVISTPGQIVVSGSSSGATVAFTVSATDAVSGDVTATASPASGSVFPVGDTTVTVTATDGAGNTTTATFVVTVLPPSLPSPWTVRNVTPYTGVAAGSVTVNSSTNFTIAGTGGASTGGTTGDFWSGNNDSFTYVSQPWTGDGIFTARLASFATPSDSLAKAGIAFRETTATGSRYSAVYFRGGSSVWFQHKTATSGSSTNVNFFSGFVSRTLPQWIRLVRSGDTFSTFYSADGSTWTELGAARTNVLTGTALTVGFVVAPRTGGTTATATFDNISFLTPLQSWRQTNFGTTVASGTAANTADPDGDGLSNLLEYGLGTAPQSAQASPLTHSLSENLVQLTFLRARSDLNYYVEVSDDLATWSVLATNPGAVGESVTVSDFVPVSSTNPRRFLRLRVEIP